MGCRTCDPCVTTASTTPLTCDGDGDGTIERDAAGSNEVFRFWQHLANAGLIEGSYNGVAGAGGNIDHIYGTNSPQSKFSGAGWGMGTTGYYGSTTMFELDYGTAMYFGGYLVNQMPYGYVLKAEEVWNIDTKVDDGKPARGKVIARRWGYCSTATLRTELNSDYKLDATGSECGVIFANTL